MTDPTKKLVVITGASGFTGKHLAHALVKKNWQVAGIGLRRLECEVEHLDADLNERDNIATWLSKIKPDYIIHLAALSHVTKNEALYYYRVNVIGTENLFLALLDSQIQPKKIIVASSANVYGNAGEIPISEQMPLNPLTHYALSKLTMEFLIHKWFNQFPIIITRPFNYTGPGQTEQFVFSKLVALFHRREKQIKLGNINVARDLSDVRFVVDAYIKLLESPCHSETINICSGREISIRDFIKKLSSLTNHYPEIDTIPELMRKDDILSLRGDPSRLFDVVGNIVSPDLTETIMLMLGKGEPS